MAKTKTLKKKSFADLLQFKESIDIYKNPVTKDEVLFTLTELGSVDFDIVFQSFWNNIGKKNEEEISKELLPFIMRKMVTSDEIEINGLSDDEIIEAIEGCGSDVAMQINDANKKLITDKIYRRISNELEQRKELLQQMSQIEKSVDEVIPKEGE